MSLIRSLVRAALRRLDDEPEPLRPMRSLPAPPASTELMLRPAPRPEPPLLYGTPVYRDAPPPAVYREPEPIAVPQRRRRKRIVVTESYWSQKG